MTENRCGLIVAVLLVLALALAAAPPLASQEPEPQDPPPEKADEGEKPQAGVFPGIEIDLKARRLTLEGEIAIPKGLLELVACAPWGKTHESICILDVEPSHFKAALLMLGLKESPQVTKLGEVKALEGDRVIIYIEWEKDGKAERHRAEKLIIDRSRNATMEEVGWVFTGSRFLKVPVYDPDAEDQDEKEVFMASQTGTLVTTFHDPNSILDNPLERGGDDTIWYANDQILPPRKTPIRFIVEVAQASKAPEEEGEPEPPEPPDDEGEPGEEGPGRPGEPAAGAA